MPVTSCKLPNGKDGYKWGEHGKCYSSRQKAIEQGRAIEISKKETDIYLKNK